MKLDDIERLAKAAERIRPPEPPTYNYRAYIDPRAVLAMIECIRAADHWIVAGQCAAYDAARAKLEGM